jgi:predicted nucleic acid-binding protein
MTYGVVDTTVIIHLFRGNPAALSWYASLVQRPAVTSITWMEIMYGAGSKAKEAKCKTILSQFDLEFLLPADQTWAMQQLERYRLSHGATTNDCLIASVCQRLQVPLYTHNLKDMTVFLNPSLVIKPY